TILAGFVPRVKCPGRKRGCAAPGHARPEIAATKGRRVAQSPPSVHSGASEVIMAAVSRRDFLQHAGGASAALAFMVANGLTVRANPLGLPIGAQAWPHRSRIGTNSYAGLAALLKDMKAIGLDAIEL